MLSFCLFVVYFHFLILSILVYLFFINIYVCSFRIILLSTPFLSLDWSVRYRIAGRNSQCFYLSVFLLFQIGPTPRKLSYSFQIIVHCSNVIFLFKIVLVPLYGSHHYHYLLYLFIITASTTLCSYFTQQITFLPFLAILTWTHLLN